MASPATDAVFFIIIVPLNSWGTNFRDKNWGIFEDCFISVGDFVAVSGTEIFASVRIFVGVGVGIGVYVG